MRVQYGDRFCPNIISCESACRGDFEKLMDVNHTPLPVVTPLSGSLEALTVGEKSMLLLYQSLSHFKYDCTSHVLFVPKYRQKVQRRVSPRANVSWKFRSCPTQVWDR